ncbi:MAG: hypothetical protein NVS2B8_09090 [Vulcanimicrobiaceae bacterium]
MYAIEARRSANVVYIRGDIDISNSAIVQEAIDAAGTSERIVVSLDACTYLDSSGLAVLYRARRKFGDRLWIVLDPKSQTHRLFEITGSLDVFHITSSLEALPSLTAHA